MKYIKIKSRICQVYAFFHKKKVHTFFCKRPVLMFLHARAQLVYLFLSADILQIKLLQINRPGPLSECQAVPIKIKTDFLLGFIWVQHVCKRLLAGAKFLG